MKLHIDTDTNIVEIGEGANRRRVPFYSKEGFEALSDLWLVASWQEKYSYTFTWFGRPIIQYPEDMVRLQEVIYSVKPTVIIETGVAHGGSLIYYASLMKGMGVGRLVVGVDIEIRLHNREAIEAHELAPMIALVEGNAVAPETVNCVVELLRPDDRILVVLDSNHSYAHVTAEMRAYGGLVSPGSYLVVTDGVMRLVAECPNAGKGWATDNPANAAEDFVKDSSLFSLEQPAWRFNESKLNKPITAWPSAYLRRK